MNADRWEAVVVGAGFAGLGAAVALRDSGAGVTVLEARDRVGGRVGSVRMPNGAVAELGAEFILPGNTAVIETAKRLGLEVADKGMRYGRREPRGGSPVDPRLFEDAVSALGGALSGSGPDGAGERESAASLLGRLEIDPAAREAILARVEISSAAPADTVPATDLAGVACNGDEPAHGLAAGNQGLAEALAAGLGDRVRLGDPVRSVAWGGAEVRVRTEGGAEVEADGCVIAIPARLVAGIAFDPALPGELSGALAAITYGHAAKLLVPLREPAPASAVMSVPERYWTWTATGEGGRETPLLGAFGGSRPALDALGVPEGGERWLRSVERLRPDLELDREGAVLSRWDDDPWAGAAYSVSPDPGAVSTIAAGAGAIRFAGEHLGGRHHGLMEGALRSGRAAAADLLDAVGAA